MNRLTLFTLAFAGAHAAGLFKRQYDDYEDYIDGVCRPGDDGTDNFDWSAPCNAVLSIQYECIYGAEYGDFLRNPPPSDDPRWEDDAEAPTEQPYEAQRVCICQSQFADQTAGCMKCNQAHGGVEGEDWFDVSLVDTAMKKYCDASTPATEGFANFFFNMVEGGDATTSSSAAESSTFSDPIGNKTDVSLYFTPSVTGTPAYVPAMPTAESSGGNVTYTTSVTSDGMIVPTAVSNEREQSSGSSQSAGSAQSGAATASSDAGAMQTALAHSGAFGALGLAAMIAAL